jgi:acyl carrier protein
MDIEARIRRFVAENLLFSDDTFAYSDDSSFLDEGVIDSRGVVELVAFVQSSFGVSVASEDITPANFDSVSNLARYLRRKLPMGE